MKKLNLNSVIKVKLTDVGKDIYFHRFDALNEWIKSRGGQLIESDYPDVDEDGYTKFQLWHFINIYGSHINMGAKNVIEPLNIYINDTELYDE